MNWNLLRNRNIPFGKGQVIDTGGSKNTKLSSKYAVGDLCEAIGVSRSAFYGWERKGSKADDYEQDVRTRYELVCTYARENPKHGSEWLAAKIYIDKKIRINHKVIERFLYGESRKDKESEKLPTDMNSKELPTDSDSQSRQNVQKMYPYIDRRKLKVVSPLRYVAADVTGLKIYGECKYLYLFVDTWSRMILGYALSNTSNDGKALRQATDMFIDKKWNIWILKQCLIQTMEQCFIQRSLIEY